VERVNENRKTVKRILSRLSEEYRTLIILKYKEGFINTEIARVLEIPENRVNVKMFRAKEKIREFLDKEKSER